MSAFQIDFVGHPGSGKSSLARLVANELGLPYKVVAPQYRDQADKMQRQRWLLLQLKYLAFGSPPMFLGIRAWRSSGHGSFRRLGSQLSLRLDETEHAESAVLDEGYRHCMASFFAVHHEMDIDRWAGRFSRHAPDVDAIVWVQCDPLVAWERFRARAGADLAPDRAQDEIRLGFERYSAVLTTMHDQNTVCIDSTDSPVDILAADVARSLRDRIPELVQRGGRRHVD